MKRTQHIVTSLTALVAIAMAGCVDIESVGSSDSATATRHQAVTVVPEFVITGADTMPETLFVSELGLTVSEIRLEPMWSNESLAYSTREPIVVEFDIADGQTVRTEQSLELPAQGRYLVSIRLEPADMGEGEPASFSLDGFVAGDRQQPQIMEDTMDGRPQPMPFDQKQDTDDEITDKEAYPQQWTPFEYRSRRAVFYTFNDVDLEGGQQFLTFSFDVRDWAIDVVEPISNAVRSSTDNDSVDVTNQIDSSGKGAEALIRTGVVRSDRRPR